MCKFYFFFFNDTATTEIYTYLHTLSLHDALPISCRRICSIGTTGWSVVMATFTPAAARRARLPIARSRSSTFEREVSIGPKMRSEEHTSELQSLMRISYAVFCLTKKKQNIRTSNQIITQTHNKESHINHRE